MIEQVGPYRYFRKKPGLGGETTYKGWPVIDRGTKVTGGIFGPSFTDENIVVDPSLETAEYDLIHQQICQGLEGRRHGDIEKDILDQVYRYVIESLIVKNPQDEEYLNKEVDYIDGREVHLSAFLGARVGVCRHAALTCALLLERFQEGGYFKGSKIGIDFSSRVDQWGEEETHAWARIDYPDDREPLIIDPSLRYLGPPTNNTINSKVSWDYFSDADIASDRYGDYLNAQKKFVRRRAVRNRLGQRAISPVKMVKNIGMGATYGYFPGESLSLLDISPHYIKPGSPIFGGVYEPPGLAEGAIMVSERRDLLSDIFFKDYIKRVDAERTNKDGHKNRAALPRAVYKVFCKDTNYRGRTPAEEGGLTSIESILRRQTRSQAETTLAVAAILSILDEECRVSVETGYKTYNNGKRERQEYNSWVRYTTPLNDVIIIDVYNGVFGTIKQVAKSRKWDYLRPEDRGLLAQPTFEELGRIAYLSSKER